jgi:hypothetical protein
MRFRSKLLLTALVALVAASFAPGAFAAVKLRALHAIPDVGPVTVYVNGQQAVPSLGTLQETPYLEVPGVTFAKDSAVTATAMGVIEAEGRPLGLAFRVKAFADYAPVKLN